MRQIAKDVMHFAPGNSAPGRSDVRPGVAIVISLDLH